MGIHHNITFGCLAENLFQLYYRETAAADNIPQDISRAYAGKLILITYQDQSGPCCHCKKQRMHQCDIYHGHLINDDHIRFQRILRIPVKMNCTAFLLFLRHPVQLQKSVDRLSLVSGSLCHSLGCTAGGGCKPQLGALLFEVTDNGIDRCSLSGSRSAGQNEQTVTGSCRHRLFLHFIQPGPCFLLDPVDPFLHHLLILRTEDIQLTEHSG